MAPAAPGSKALVVCSEGREEAVTAAGWAAASRGAGAAVSVCPPDHLSSHAKAAAGSYDFVVVEEAGKGKGEISDAVLGEVSGSDDNGFDCAFVGAGAGARGRGAGRILNVKLGGNLCFSVLVCFGAFLRYRELLC